MQQEVHQRIAFSNKFIPLFTSTQYSGMLGDHDVLLRIQAPCSGPSPAAAQGQPRSLCSQCCKGAMFVCHFASISKKHVFQHRFPHVAKWSLTGGKLRFARAAKRVQKPLQNACGSHVSLLIPPRKHRFQLLIVVLSEHVSATAEKCVFPWENSLFRDAISASENQGKTWVKRMDYGSNPGKSHRLSR